MARRPRSPQFSATAKSTTPRHWHAIIEAVPSRLPLIYHTDTAATPGSDFVSISLRSLLLTLIGLRTPGVIIHESPDKQKWHALADVGVVRCISETYPSSVHNL